MKLAPFTQRFSCRSGPNTPAEFVLVHGWGLHSQVWDDLVPHLLVYAHVTLVDLPGMGRSPVSNQRQTLVSMAQTIMPHLPERFVYVGWSLGALVGMECARQYPDRVSALVSVAMLPCFTQKPHWPHGLPVSQLSQFQALFEEDWQGALARFLSLQCQGAANQRAHINLLKQLVFFHGLPNQRVLAESLVMLAEADYLDWLTNTRTRLPMLFLLGEQDPLVSVQAAGFSVFQCSNICVQTIERTAHLPFLDAPAEFCRRMLAWLELEGQASL